MAITRDLLFVDTQVKALTNAIALNLGDTTAGAFKIALFQDSVTPDASQANPAYGSSPFSSGEVSGAGYSAGGLALTSVVFEELSSSPGYVRWDFDNISWPSSTITDAKGGLFYATGLSNRAIVFRSFIQEYSSQDGTFSVNIHTDGVIKLNVVGPLL
ncbi:hypothetical protein FH608_046035 [Nonomuraea phyllanthi]|uniref:Uncharacterized protein n=1 Tax=Nonomuraea phyllanthi TaxID=2219224 RepID=A0A5C4V5Y2_9ACTN|nr:hypothetical protein [Nonomuraea phyllanthi]KAB8186856.1 hypothetical protein FH608_046035 [Nonomuraea phyllanthi]